MSSLAQAPIDRMTSESTRIAMKDTLLTPRFYTTDFDAMDRIDVSAIRPQWEALNDVLAAFHRHGFGQAAVVGEVAPRGQAPLVIR